ncbi:hypothetical protein SAMN05216312_10931 [Cohnella sp. OV330]|uniref:glycan biosynthesis hexose transferase WsfD n=1 Tax=Cohnella sp. OV330 TaxID=1855288 RepID=UPI0008F282C9|nr:hypothetical protein [Cohnella sp. OV330]SFB46616.1 hypothetical protein SAMN05216312_10931 [Cohnella sp. OV330]
MSRSDAPGAGGIAAYWKRIFKAATHYASPALIAAAAVLAISAAALFVKPYVGMADNGDYFRILYSNGIYFNATDYAGQYFGYFIKHYGIFQYFNENGATLSSSQSLFVRLALRLNIWFLDARTFDIRIQAAIYLILYTVAVYMLVEALTWKAPAKRGYAIAAIAVFIFGDTAYTAYFNSFYSEALMLIMSLFVLASGLLIYRRRFNDYAMLAVFVISSLLLVTSKQQNAPLGILIALFGIFVLLARSDRRYRISAAGGLTLLLAVSIASYVLIPQEFVNINKYHAMTRGVLPDSGDPEQSLESMGIDRQYSLLSGSIYYEPYTTIDVNSNKMLTEFYGKFGFGKVLAYYATHPDQAIRMLNLAAKGAFTTRPETMGNYEKSEGLAFGAQTHFFSLYSVLKKALTPKTFGFIFLWTIVVIGLYMPSFVSAVRTKNRRQAVRLPLLLTMILLGLAGIAISIVGAGDADLAKHEFMFTIVFDLVTFMTVSDALLGRLWRNVPLRPDTAPAATTAA